MEAGGATKCLSSRTPGLKLSLFLFHSVLFITETQTASTGPLHIPPHRRHHHQFLSRPLHPVLLHISVSTKWKSCPPTWELVFNRTETHHIFPRAVVNFPPSLLFLPRLRLNLASRLAGAWTPAARHWCCGMYQISRARKWCWNAVTWTTTHTHTHTHTHTLYLSLSVVRGSWKRECVWSQHGRIMGCLWGSGSVCLQHLQWFHTADNNNVALKNTHKHRERERERERAREREGGL